MFQKLVIIMGLLILSLLMGCGTGSKSRNVFEEKSGEYSLKLAFKTPPVSGENQAVLILKNASGNIVDNAVIKIHSTTPAMPDRPPMSFRTQAKPTESGYKATLDFPMSGTWKISVLSTIRDKHIESVFSIDVR